MGCFDYITHLCPNCRKEDLYLQSKAGECELNRYDLKNIPIEIAFDLDGYEVTCSNCKSVFVVRVNPLTPRYTSMEIEEIKDEIE